MSEKRDWKVLWYKAKRLGIFANQRAAARELGISERTFNEIVRGDRLPPTELAEPLEQLFDRIQAADDTQELLIATSAPPSHQDQPTPQLPLEGSAELFQQLTRGYLRGRRPLFVLGAGVSAKRFPLLHQMASWFAEHLAKAGLDKSDPHKILDRARKIAARKATREDVAEFFHFLQTSKDPVLRRAWGRFSVHLLDTGLKVDEHISFNPLSKIQATVAHERVGEMLANREAFCVSLNFDRLTYEGAKSAAGSAIILSEADQVRRYFSSSRSSEEEGAPAPAVVKIRGDVFYAYCTRTECPRSANPLPLHQMKSERKEKDEQKQVEVERESLECPECGQSTLKLQLSFPGFERKQAAALDVLTELITFIGHRLSSIIFVGLSGRWDSYLLDQLFALAESVRIPVADVRPQETNAQSEYIAPFAARYYPSLKVWRIYEDADAFFEQLNSKIETSSEQLRWSDPPKSQPDLLAGLPSTELYDSEIWFPSSQPHPRTIEVAIEGGELKVEAESLAKRLAAAPSACSLLKSLAQLDLKNIWALESPEKHTRFYHSLGTAAVGMLWYDRLRMDDRRPSERRLLRLDTEVEKTLLANALFYHDYGHLPFSHLSERILSYMNWLSDSDQLFGIELSVLAKRLTDPELQRALSALAKVWLPMGVPGASTPVAQNESVDLVGELLLDFVAGRFGRTWMQCIVNSPIDADKIDYLIRDQQALRDVLMPTRSRLSYNVRDPCRSPWLHEFLERQEVSPNGFICLYGRSAIAGVELINERHSLYRSFYLAPEMRVFERMATEIISQFAIQVVMAAGNSRLLAYLQGKNCDLSSARLQIEARQEVDLREQKRDLVRSALETIHATTGSDFLKEGGSLEAMWKALEQGAVWDPTYADFMGKIWNTLEPRLKFQARGGAQMLGAEASRYLIGEPIFVEGHSSAELQEALRPLAHSFCTEVLIDVVRFPPMFGVKGSAYVPYPKRSKNRRRLFAGFIVPAGPALKWTWESVATVPLGQEAIGNLDAEETMVLVIDPGGERSPAAAYAYDQVRAVCRGL